MTLRDGGLVALGVLVGWMAAGALMLLAAREVESTDRILRGLRLRYHLESR